MVWAIIAIISIQNRAIISLLAIVRGKWNNAKFRQKCQYYQYDSIFSCHNGPLLMGDIGYNGDGMVQN